MKKTLVLVLVFVLICSICVPVSAATEQVIALSDGQFIGISSGMKQRSVPESGSVALFENVLISIDYMNVHNSIDMCGTISTQEGDVDFHFTGELYVSRKCERGIEAYIGDVEDQYNNFEIVYFEIKNDYSRDLLKYSDSLLEKRTISFDVQKNGVSYYFELDLDELGVSFDHTQITEIAPEEIDFFAVYVDEDTCVGPYSMEYDPELLPIQQSRSTTSYIETGDLWYYEEVVSGWFSSSTYAYYAVGGIEGDIVDVGTAGSANWTVKIRFWGSVWKDGEEITNQTNYFNMKAGVYTDTVTAGEPIELHIYTGNNTLITSGYLDGLCKNNGRSTDEDRLIFQDPNIFNLLIGTVEAAISQYVSLSGTAKAVAFAANILSNIEPTEYTLGGLIIPSGEKKCALALQFDDGISLDESDHMLMFSCFASVVNSSLTSNVATSCYIVLEFNMCNGNRILEHEKVVRSVQYTTNVK